MRDVFTFGGFVLVWRLLSGLVGMLIGRPKGRTWSGFWWGFALTWIGWIVVAVQSPTLAWEMERQRRLGGIPMSNGSTAPTLVDRFAQLERLHERRLISPEEYDARRQRLLGPDDI